MAELPILYSFRRCPYAMRARLALASAGIRVALREVDLRHKPAALLAVSPKGTVPVLISETGQVLEQSLDIMFWALQRHDPDLWLAATSDAEVPALIAWNDGEFKRHLDRYKYADRYPEQTQSFYRQQGESFLAELEHRLTTCNHLAGDAFSLVDAAIAPFIRQFAAVDAVWFAHAPYPNLQRWLQHFQDSPLFKRIMIPHLPWEANAPLIIFG